MTNDFKQLSTVWTAWQCVQTLYKVKWKHQKCLLQNWQVTLMSQGNDQYIHETLFDVYQSCICTIQKSMTSKKNFKITKSIY